MNPEDLAAVKAALVESLRAVKLVQRVQNNLPEVLTEGHPRLAEVPESGRAYRVRESKRLREEAEHDLSRKEWAAGQALGRLMKTLQVEP